MHSYDYINILVLPAYILGLESLINNNMRSYDTQ